MKKILASLEFIMRSPIKIEDSSLEKEITNDGNTLIRQIIVTMRIVCSNLLLSPTTEPKNGTYIYLVLDFEYLTSLLYFSAYFHWSAEYLPG